MGSNVVVVVHGGVHGHLALARDRLAFLEARWSRFREHSDLSRLNAGNGQPVVVDPCTIELLEAMVHAHLLTDGSFDPTLLEPLVRLGYAASVHDPALVSELPPGVQTRGAIRGLVINVDESTARLPPGTAVDAGGLGKGLAADVVAELLLAHGVDGAMVDVGGDIRVVGDGPFDGHWLVAIDGPFDPEQPSLGLMVDGGGVGTSGTLRRSWITADGTPAHHVLDPTFATPTPGGFDAPVHATVLAPTAKEAEMHSTAALVRGPASALPSLQMDGRAARIVDGSGRAHTNALWDRVVVTDDL